MHDQSTAAAPGALAVIPTSGRAKTIQAVVAAFMRPTVGVPMDGTAVAAAPAATGEGGAPAAPAGGGPAAGGGGAAPAVPAPAPPMPVPAAPAVPAQPPAPVPAPPPSAPPVVPAAPAAAPPVTPPAPVGDPNAPIGTRDLSHFPAEVQSYIRDLRNEAATFRTSAKTAEDAAQAKVADLLAKAGQLFGFTQAPPEASPQEQIEHLTTQLNGAQSGQKQARVELAIWRGSHAHGANPQRLADSRSFLSALEGLDPGASDFDTKVSDAIAKAVAEQDYYRAAAPAAPAGGQAPPSTPLLPPVASGGEFGGGTGGQQTQPNSVDDFRAAFREARGVR